MSLNNHRRPFVVILTVLTALLGLVVAAVPSAAATMAAAAGSPPVSLTASAAPRLPSGAALVGPVSPAATMAVTVTLAIPDQAALTAFLNGLADPASPYYEHYLAPGQFGPMFGPSLDQVAAVENALRAAGLSPGPVAPDRLSIPVTATASAVEHAFGVTLDRYRLAGGRLGFANTTAPKIPAAVAPLVQGVLGLNDLYPVQHAGGPVSGSSRAGTRPAGIRPAETRILSRMAATTGTAGRAVNSGPQPCSLIAPPNRLFGFTATDIAAGYGLAQRYVEGDFGQGARVGVVELEPNLTSDITAYEQCYRISTKVTYTKVDGGAGNGAGSGEAARSRLRPRPGAPLAAPAARTRHHPARESPEWLSQPRRSTHPGRGFLGRCPNNLFL
jgi:subtilase family serine protease